MTELKCPFCQQELRQDQDGFYTCYTDNCGCMKYGGNGASGSESLWLALIRTRKALVVAVDALKELKPQKAKGGGYWAVKSADAIKLINTTIKQITALEQGW